MNKDTVLIQLVRFLSEYSYSNLIIEELLGLISKSGNEKRFFTLLISRLRILGTMGIDAVNLTEFENIGKGIYSMHLAAKGFNIRILYGFLPNRKPVLLLAFYERAGKKKTDYSPHLETAQRRLEQEEARYNNEH